MNNIPENMREFNVVLAQLGHPIATRDGREAKFIAYVPELVPAQQLIINIMNCASKYYDDGRYHIEPGNYDLFLAPLGFVENKPVFAGDILMCRGKEFSPPIGYNGSWDDLSWPKPKCVVETRMEWADFRDVYWFVAKGNGGESWHSVSARNLANKAIERAIADGDVIPTNVVEELIVEALIKRDESNYPANMILVNRVLKEYKEGLK